MALAPVYDKNLDLHELYISESKEQQSSWHEDQVEMFQVEPVFE